MPFDPSLPAPNSPLESQVIRDQLQALFNQINSIVTVTVAQVTGTNTLPPGAPANVGVNVVGNTLHFTFDIPQGADGPVGIPGEVTNADLNTAISNAVSGTSNNSNAVGTLNQLADPNYNQPQMQAMMDKMDELIQALRR